MPALKDRVDAELKDAMRARDRVRIDALRSILSAISYRRIEAGRDLSDSDELDVVRKQVKQRVDAIAEYTKAGRAELAEKEEQERAILKTYLPPEMGDEELQAMIRETLATLEPTARTEGGAMKVLMPKLRGLADGNRIKSLIAQELSTAADG